jgi:FtsP/CotA-like multicopper oxidase with cupredoxin domain
MMTIREAQPWVKRGLLTTILLVTSFIGLRWLPLAADPRQTPREVELVVRDMAFYLPGNDTPNPTLRFAAGERVRIVLRNDQPGVSHNFVINGWDVRTRELRGRGTTRVEFQVPSERGGQRYECAPHAAMMSGAIDVR